MSRITGENKLAVMSSIVSTKLICVRSARPTNFKGVLKCDI